MDGNYVLYLVCSSDSKLVGKLQVQNAQSAVDYSCPPDHPHVLIKLKKIQKERERMQEIERENQRLLQKLSQIMATNRVENYWKDPHPRYPSVNLSGNSSNPFQFL